MRAMMVMLAALATALQAASVSGTILIRKKLTKPGVTSPVSIYQRGPDVPLGPGVQMGSEPQPGCNTAKHEAGCIDRDPLDDERRRVVIWIEGATAAGAGPGEVPPSRGSGAARMEQTGRRFVPDLVVIPAGSSVSFPNLDPIFHNVFSLSRAKTFDLGNYVKGDSRSVTFPKAGIVFVNCHLHPNMSAAIVVTPNAWNTIASKDGQYALRDLPPGSYTVVAWHKAAGFFRKTVTVTDSDDLKVDFFIPIGENETLKAPRLKTSQLIDSGLAARAGNAGAGN